jgi:hypothetical protein
MIKNTNSLVGIEIDWAVNTAFGCEIWLCKDFIRARHEYLKSML